MHRSAVKQLTELRPTVPLSSWRRGPTEPFVRPTATPLPSTIMQKLRTGHEIPSDPSCRSSNVMALDHPCPLQMNSSPKSSRAAQYVAVAHEIHERTSGSEPPWGVEGLGAGTVDHRCPSNRSVSYTHLTLPTKRIV